MPPPPPRPPQPPSPSPVVGKKGEWIGFDSGLGRLETKEGGEGSMVILCAKLGLPGSLPCWHSHLACHLSKKWQKHRRVTVCDGKCVGARVKMANEGVSSVRMAKS